LVAYRNLPVRPQAGEPIRVGALVALDQEGMARRIFLAPDAAGLRIVDEGQDVLVITPRSPLGQAPLRRCEGDEVELLVDGRRERCVAMEVRSAVSDNAIPTGSASQTLSEEAQVSSMN